MTQLRLHLLGEPYLERDGTTTPLRTKKQQRWIALLAYLALQRRESTRQHLASMIWNDAGDSLERLRKHSLNELRGKIGGDLLEADRETVRLRTEDIWIDVNDFHQSLNDYRMRLSTDEDVNGGMNALEKAFSLYRGEFLGSYTLLDSEEFYFWQIAQARTLRAQFSEAAEELVMALYFRDELDKAQHYARLWREQDAENLNVHAWKLVLFDAKEDARAADLYVQRLQPIFNKWGISESDLRAKVQEIQRRLKQLHLRNRYLPAARDQAIKHLLDSQLKASGIVQVQDNPSFFDGYHNVLFELAEHHPLEAVKSAEVIADALFGLQDSPEQAKAVLDRVEGLIAEKQGELSEEVKFRLLLQRLNIYRAFGLTRQAVELVDEVLKNEVCLEGFDAQLKAAWYIHLGLIQCWVKNDYENALNSLMLAQKYCRLSGQWTNEAGVLGDIGLIYWNQGELVRAEAALVAARAQAAQFGNFQTMLKITGNLGLVYLYQGKMMEAYGYMEEHYRLATELGHLKERRRARGNRGITKFHLGDYAGAIEDLEEDIRSLTMINEGTLHATVNLGRCYLASGDAEHGCELLTWSLGQARERGYSNIRIIALRALAECKPREEAVDMLREALNAARGKRRIDEAACLLALAKLSDNPKDYEEYWQEGVRILHKMGAQAWLEDDMLHLPTL